MSYKDFLKRDGQKPVKFCRGGGKELAASQKTVSVGDAKKGSGVGGCDQLRKLNIDTQATAIAIAGDNGAAM